MLGQDREALLRLQHDLLSFVDEIEQVAGQDAFNQQIAAAEAQVDLLGEIKRVNEQHLTEMNKTLRRFQKFLARGASNSSGNSRAVAVSPRPAWREYTRANMSSRPVRCAPSAVLRCPQAP